MRIVERDGRPRAIQVPRIDFAVMIDGDLSEWKGMPFHVITEPATSRGRAPRQEDAISARLYLGWDDAHLYVAVAVDDDSHFNTKDGGGIWDGDQLQFAVDPLVPGQTHFEASVALASGRVQGRQHRGPVDAWLDQTEYAVVRDDDAAKTFYELKIPFETLHIEPAIGVDFALNAQVFNDDDGEGFEYWIQWTSPGRPTQPFGLYDADVYAADAEWIEQYASEMQKLVHAGELARIQADHLQRLGAPDASALVQSFNGDIDTGQRLDIMWTLGRIGGLDAVRLAVEQIQADDTALAAMAGDILLRFHQDGSYPALLVDHDDSQAVALLGKALHAPERQLQYAALHALGDIDSDAADQALNAAVADGDWTIKRLAARILHEQGRQTDAELAEEAEGWPMWRYSPARDADTPVRLPEQLHLQWVRELPAPSRAWPHQWDDRGKLDFDVSYAPVAVGQRIFVPSNVSDSVTAYDIDSGRELWRFHADGPVRLAPAVWRGRLFVAADDGRLYCLDAQSGRLLWGFRGGPSDHRLLGNERIINFWPARGGPVVYDGTVYFAAGIWPLHGVFIHALDAVTGEPVWINDTTSSEYVALPHGGADGYGGLAPQGYIAASADRLVVSPGRGQSPVFLDRRTGRVVASQFRGAKGGGGYAVNAEGQGKARNAMLQRRVDSVSQFIDGGVFYELAVRDRLVVTTEDGKLYCFGPEPASPIRHRHQLRRLEPRTGAWAQTAAGLLEQLGESAGYALMLGAGSGDLMRELLLQSNLHVAVVESDPATVRELRDELVAAGMYGRRAALIEAAPATFTVQPYLFSLVLSEDAAGAGFGADPAVLAYMLERLRPYGGIAYVRGVDTTEQAIRNAMAVAGVDQVSIRIRENVTNMIWPGLQRRLFGRRQENLLAARRGGPLTGAGQWTHQLHDAANTLVSKDSRVRLPLGILWFGGPNNHNILPRHAGGPRPQVAGGRQVFLGVESIAARCVYTGRQLWERELPGIGHPFTNLQLEQAWREGNEVYMSNTPGATYIGSPFVTLHDAIYVRYQGRILRLDPATGRTTGRLTPPGRPANELYADDDVPDWGHLSVQGQYLLTTGEPHIFENQALGKDSSYSGTSSRRIGVFDRRNGRLLWQREANVGFRHNAIVSSDDVLFVIDGLSDNAVRHLARRGQTPEQTSVLMALDLRTGAERWRRNSEVFGTFLLYSRKHDILLEGGSQDMRFRGAWAHHEDEPRQVMARRGDDGEILWRTSNFLLPGALRGDMLIPGRPGNAVSILTGETWQREQPLSGSRTNWSYRRRYGCNTLNASEHLLLYRTGYAGYFDLEHDSGTGNFSGFRSGCTPSMVAADGVLNALDYTRTCTCSYAIQTSLAMIHMPDDPNLEFWTRYDSALPSPLGHGINFGAPGRRVDVAGGGRVWHDRQGTYRRHPSAIIDNGGGINWVLASALETNDGNSIRIDDVVEGVYTVRLHFAELEAGVLPGQRVFDVLVDGVEVLTGWDIVAQTGGPLRGAVHEFQVDTGDGLTLEFRRADGTSRPPTINGIELIRNHTSASPE